MHCIQFYVVDFPASSKIYKFERDVCELGAASYHNFYSYFHEILGEKRIVEINEYFCYW